MPARKNPVLNRASKSPKTLRLGKISKKLENDAKNAQNMNTRDGENRSAIIKIPNNKVPIIKPNCTDDKT